MKAILVQPIGLSSDAEHKAIFCGGLLGRRKLQPRHVAGDAAGDSNAVQRTGAAQASTRTSPDSATAGKSPHPSPRVGPDRRPNERRSPRPRPA